MHEDQTTTPLFSEAILGYRIFETDPLGQYPLLVSPYTTDAWNKGINYASCQADIPCRKNPPGEFCECGLYAYYDFWFPLSINSYEDLRLGAAIAGRGEVRTHFDGFRAAEAQILALYSGREDKKQFSSAIAKYYGVPLFDDTESFESFVGTLPVVSFPESAIPSQKQLTLF